MQGSESKEIFVIMHNICDIYVGACYVPLYVGAYRNPGSGIRYRDDKGINISVKNDSYCELTGLYWIWKNCRAEYVGLVHYRRYFVKISHKHELFHREFVLHKKNIRILSAEELINLISGSELLVKNSDYDFVSNKERFQMILGDELLDDLQAIITQDTPEYLSTYINLLQENRHFNCNMFFGKKEIIDRYCGWLFYILGKLDAMHMKKYGDWYHHRELGYCGELLFKVWIIKNEVPYQIVDAVNIENYPTIINLIKRIIKKIGAE